MPRKRIHCLSKHSQLGKRFRRLKPGHFESLRASAKCRTARLRSEERSWRNKRAFRRDSNRRTATSLISCPSFLANKKDSGKFDNFFWIDPHLIQYVGQSWKWVSKYDSSMLYSTWRIFKFSAPAIFAKLFPLLTMNRWPSSHHYRGPLQAVMCFAGGILQDWGRRIYAFPYPSEHILFYALPRENLTCEVRMVRRKLI